MSSQTSTSSAIAGCRSNNNGGANKDRGPHRNRAPRTDSRIVRLSKSLAWLLRHNAQSQGIAIRPDGYVKVVDILGHPRFKGYTLEEVVEVVDMNEKKRFQFLGTENGDGKKEYIRAVQGHSIVADLGLEDITDASQVPIVVHGTMLSKWPLISAQGLSRMGRNHIHMAAGLLGEHGVISGMRSQSSLYIYIDTAKALRDGVKFYRSPNNVILSDGKDGDGIIAPEYFVRVVKSSGEVIYPKTVVKP
ncbi:putative tRNA 2'-phosphotransferase [Gamsiella multidivaricata]|uniref:putative tRNA 2'-phosphotransferase n=1 Tax=Gamsiella multidivaricata TaxID=101098 RepID=UPI0022203002|nr:putative tRNA 2'-phosphotransferase [Gamsiella multidivaricata]KAI7825399.1 putative tRNA 2'-phosphotransferase [Gamsiella multidivaricata]